MWTPKAVKITPPEQATAAVEPIPSAFKRTVGRLLYAGLQHEFPRQPEPAEGRRRYLPSEVCTHEQWEKLITRHCRIFVAGIALPLVVDNALMIKFGGLLSSSFGGTLAASAVLWGVSIVPAALHMLMFPPWDLFPGLDDARGRAYSGEAADATRKALGALQQGFETSLAQFQNAKQAGALDLETAHLLTEKGTNLLDYIERNSKSLAAPGLTSDAIFGNELDPLRSSTAQVLKELSVFAVRALNAQR